MALPHTYSARCYCGNAALQLDGPAETVAICHCTDCKRWTGAPMPAFAAFPNTAIQGLTGDGVETNQGVKRWNCTKCGSPLAATFSYLPDQIYIPIGVIDDADGLTPEIHCFAQHALDWLHIDDGLPKEDGTGRDKLVKPR